MAQGSRIPDDAVDLVRVSVAIEDVVRARGIELKRVGAEQVGLCPFHDDHNASMHLYREHGLGRYKCFSCGAAGDAIDFVANHDGVDFRTALADLAQMGGVDVPELHGQSVGQLGPEKREQLEKARKEAANKREIARKLAEGEELVNQHSAIEVAKEAEPDAGDGLAARYLQGRGIDTTAAWPAGFCRDLRSADGTLDWMRIDGKWKPTTATMMVGVLRDARARPVGVQRIYLDTSGGQVRKRGGDAPDKMTLGTASGACVRLSDQDPREMESPGLVLTEGIETGAAVMAALYGDPVWAALSTSGLRSFELPDELRGVLHTVVIAADLDKSDAGRAAAVACAERIKEQSPATVVRIAMPRCEDAPGLFDAQGEPKGKSVDWLDMSLEAGAGVVAEAMDRAPEWKGEGDVRGGADGGGGGVSADGGGGGGDDGGRAHPGSSGDGMPNRPLPFRQQDHLLFARNVLLDLYCPPEDDRKNSRWLIAWYDDKWYRRLPGESRWRKDNPKRVHAQVWHQLRSYWVVDRRAKKDKDGNPIPKRFAPTAQSVRGILEAMATECGVYAEQLPAWAPSTFDEKGEPTWCGSAHVYDDVAGTIDPRSAVATRSGILDADAWAQGELRVEPLTPLWFSTGTMPHHLPIEKMRAAIDDGACEDGLEGVDLFEELCPTWMAFLRDITEPYSQGGGEDADNWILGLQEWFGYLLTYDTSFETIGLMTGPTRSGKGTVQSAMRSILGEGQVASSTFRQLVERWKPLDLVDKPVCIMSDASIGRYVDPVAAAEILKNIRGGDPLSIEKHNQGFVDAVVVPTRMMIFVNELPKLPDSSGALAASMINWPTIKSFEGKEDRGLKPRIVAEAAGILVWALFGLRRLRKRGVFTRCQAGEKVLDEMRSLGSPVYKFVVDECVLGNEQKVAKRVLYDLYTQWAKDEGHGELSFSRFGVQLRTVVPSLDETKPTVEGKRMKMYVGLRPSMDRDTFEAMEVTRMEQVRPPEPYLGT